MCRFLHRKHKTITKIKKYLNHNHLLYQNTMRKFTTTHQLRFGLIVLSLFSFLASHAITIYFKDTNNSWGGVNIHVWNATISSDETSGWPGKAMIWKATDGSDTWYKIELQSTTASFKFNRIANNSTQTSNFENITIDGWYDSGSSGPQDISGVPSGLNFELSLGAVTMSSDALDGWGVRTATTNAGGGIFTLVKLYTQNLGIDIWYGTSKHAHIATTQIIGHSSSMVGKLATFTWNANTNVLSIAAGITITSNLSSPIDAGTNVTLTASATNEPSNYVWEYSINNGGTWLPYTGTKTGTKDESITVTPSTTTIYRATMGSDNGTLELLVKKACAHETRTLFIDDFGTLVNQTDRTISPYVPATNYTYKPSGKEIRDGHYAVVTTPRFAGCGTHTGDNVAGCNVAGDYWYVDLKDRSNRTTTPFGGMLFVNCRNKDADVAKNVVYTRQTINLPPNVELTFSAWFANAQNPTRGTSVDINMRFQILDASNTVVSGSIIDVPAIAAGTGWFYGETTINTGSGGLFTVQILNNGESGYGNDVLIDDIELKVCVPQVSLNVDGQTNVTVTGLHATSTLTVPESVSSLFSSPYYLWLEYNPTTQTWEEVTAFSGVNKPTNNTSFTSYTPSTKQFKVYVASDRQSALDGFNLGTGLYIVTNPVSLDLCDIITQPSASGEEVCEGTPATALSVVATSGSGTLSYQWYSNTTASNVGGTLITGAESSTFTPPTTSAGSTYYYVVVSSTNGCSMTSNVSGEIKVNPKIMPTFNAVGPYCSGDIIPALSTSSTNSPAITGTWSPAISNTATQTYTFTPTAGACANTTILEIVVNEIPNTPSIDVDCTLGFAKGVLTVTAPLDVNFEYALNGGTYQDSPTFTGIANGNNSIVVRNKTTQCTSAATNLNVDCGCASLPTVSFGTANGSTCHTNAITITGNTFGGSTTEVTITHNGSGILTDATFTSSPFNVTYTPDPSDAGKTIEITAITNNPLGLPCIASSAIYELTIESLITPTFTAIDAICQLDNLNPLPTTSLNGINGSWSPALDNTQTTEYTFTPDAGQCASEVKMTIIVHDKPAQPTATVTQPTCATLRGAIDVNNHVDGLTYSINGVDFVNETSFANLLPTNYTIIARNANQCLSEASSTLTVDETSCLVMNKTVNNASPNIGDNVIFTLSVTNNGPSDATGVVVTDILPDGYQFVSAPVNYAAINGIWTIGTIAAGASASIQLTALVNTTGNYTNIATITGGDENDLDPSDNTDDATTSPLHPLPVANDDVAYTNENTPITIDVTKNDSFGAPNAPKTGTVVITTHPDASKGTATVNNNGTPTNPTDDKIIFTPKPGYFGDVTMEYEITNYNVDKDRATVTITVSGMRIPDGFSPNGDAINDTFVIQRSSNLTINLIVFNRWGNKVFEQANYANDWEGTGINNQALPEGTYYRIVEAINNTTGQTQKLSGVITLKR